MSDEPRTSDAGVQLTQGPPLEENAPVGVLIRLASAAWPPRRDGAAKARVRAHWLRHVAARRRRRRWLLAAAGAVAAGMLVWVATLARAPGGLLGGRGSRLGPTQAAVATVERLVAPTGSDATPPMDLLRADGHPLQVGDVVGAGVSLETAPGAVAALRLGAASLRLDAATRLEMTAPGSMRLERGALYLDSPPGSRGRARRRLTVATARGTVVELGTQFEVRLEAGTLRVRVREGAVEIHDVSTRGPSGEHVAAGSELEMPAAGPPLRRRIPTSGPSWDWMLRAAPPMRFEGRTLSEVLRWVSRETGLVVEFEDPTEASRARGTVLHGPLDDLDPEGAVEVVLPTCGLRGRVDGGRLVVAAVGE